ncbi:MULTISPECIES: hypothetical protein [Bacillus]|uniref:Uncharacterized protein n=4 Tax=Bacillus cereus group TaxID=86661 RepID=A0ABV3IBL4_9BACI|nr:MULTISPECIES: hypothetical protein [Bacillus]MBJ8096391.1 hypothetical protein [Bacillus cereus]MBJ8107210.1 hypothetical protein [Bacillus cereus group sp. N8]MCQ6360163.1 hypothetical protein [Bacillus cereus]MDM5431066.1 hypothetical protein [Bacillus mycoides]MED1042533.1 hypothetical protein [Bacillus mycoides]
MYMFETIAQMLVLGDAMDGLINTGNSFITWMQRGAMVSTAIVFCWGAYLLIWGGERGRHKCIWWFIGGAAGLVIVMGCQYLAESVNSNVKFGQILFPFLWMK